MFFYQRRSCYDEVLWQLSCCFLLDCPIHTTSSRVSYNRISCRADGLWLVNLYKYSESIYCIICSWAGVSYFRMHLFLCTAWPGGTDGKSFSLWRRTAFKCDFEESVNSRQSPRLCSWPSFLTGCPRVDHILLSSMWSLYCWLCLTCVVLWLLMGKLFLCSEFFTLT